MSRPAVRPLNPRRIAVIARHTFTQLVRMKVFYFFAFFAVVVIAANFFELPTHVAPENAGTEVLFAIKNTSIGCMSLFSIVLSIVATALLLPKDVEDRTLYTILAKPVPRLDYLVGKFFGVAALIFVSLLMMDVLMNVVLAHRTGVVVEQQRHFAEHQGYDEASLAQLAAHTRELGPTWNLQAAVLAVFLRSLVLTAIALLLSSFSTSTLFTAVVGFLILFAGFFQADARDTFFDAQTTVGRVGGGLMAIVLPDLQFYNLVDAIIEGKVAELKQVLMAVGSTAFYVVTYLFASWLVFARKEI